MVCDTIRIKLGQTDLFYVICLAQFSGDYSELIIAKNNIDDGVNIVYIHIVVTS